MAVIGVLLILFVHLRGGDWTRVAGEVLDLRGRLRLLVLVLIRALVRVLKLGIHFSIIIGPLGTVFW